MSNKKGILLLATSHPYYGRMAYNLAVSIRATGSEIPIAVLSSGRGLTHLNDRQRKVFDQIIDIPQEAFAAKLCIDQYSPFETTLYLDSDMAWLYKNKPEVIFDAIPAENDFQIIIEGHYDPETGDSKLHPKYNFWADIELIKAAYKLKGRLYQFRSEVIYFKKTARVKALFKKAREVRDKPKIDVGKFGGYTPDEFGLNVAASLLDFRPSIESWQPSYWWNITKKMMPMPIIAAQYFLFSVGGNFSNPSVKKLYNQIMAAAFHKQRLQYLFILQSKRDSIKERSLM